MAYTTIDDPTIYFNTLLYTGNATARSITGVGFAPNWVWIKDRSVGASEGSHALLDTVRGATKVLISNNSDSEFTGTTTLTSFDSDGFSLGTNVQVNTNTSNIVSWNWKAGGSASSNSNGSITSSVSASTTAGFSIVSYTGTGSNATIGHGLGVTPKWIIFKNRSATKGWSVYHTSYGATKFMFLNETSATQTYSPMFNDTEPTSSVFSVGTDLATNVSGNNYIAYCFAEKKGYSKFGSYTGNGNADGTFVYTGFKPSWVLVKNTSGSGDNWTILDNKRLGYNPDNRLLFPNANNADYTAVNLDLLSNGFKARSTDTTFNGSGATYIYMAFAENPFVTSTGVPNNARWLCSYLLT